MHLLGWPTQLHRRQAWLGRTGSSAIWSRAPMPSSVKIANVQQALQQRLYPSVTIWNRLEGRPRTNNFDRALRAEVRDGLWMITKQWQMGEIRGNDAGSPVFAKLQIDTTRLTKYQPASLPPPGLAKTKFAAYGCDVDSLFCRGTKTQAGQRRAVLIPSQERPGSLYSTCRTYGILAR
jgi:hypothetical protein